MRRVLIALPSIVFLSLLATPAAASTAIPAKYQIASTSYVESTVAVAAKYQASPGIIPQKCFTTTGKATYRNALGWEIMRFKMTQFWCTKNSEINIVQPASTTGWVSTFGAVGGWDYRGLTNSSSADYWYWYDAGYNSRRLILAHATKRQGYFQYCGARVGCVRTARPYIRFYKHSDNTANVYITK